jgi:hypothetical protein
MNIVISICPKEVAEKFWSLERFGHENEKVQQYEYLFIQQWSERDNWLVVVHIKTTKVLASTSSVFLMESTSSVINSAYVDWKTFLSRLNIAGPKPG